MWMFKPEPKLVAADDALPGRTEPIVDPAPHAVLGTPITGPWKDCLLYTSPSPRD